jgi:uncharacterized protein with WD repeat
METGRERLQILKEGGGIGSIEYSPRDTYLITSEKFTKGYKNLKLWHTQTGEEVTSFEFRKTSREGPKSIKFTKDERFCIRLASKTEIEVYQTQESWE